MATGSNATLFGLNALDWEDRDWLYVQLVPKELLTRYRINAVTLTAPDGWPRVCITAPKGVGSVEVELRVAPDARDPVLYIHLADTMNLQIELLLFVLNDVHAPRFETDRLPDGRRTMFGTAARNLDAEAAALRAGLAPGQVRRGLRLGRRVLECVEAFAAGLGRAMWMLQPLAYHNAILFERWGFTYLTGIRRMTRWDAEFRPGGPLHGKLDGSTPFRQPDAWRTIRGRSWAIHDGILDEPFSEIQMYKSVGKHAGITTFPDGAW